MKKIISCIGAGIITIAVQAQEHRFDPPWNDAPEAAVNFTVPGIDNVPDIYGDINDPQLVVFFAGNQFMCVDDLLAAFKKQYPQYKRVLVETLPPGILAKQIQGGSLTIGNMRITVQPDIYAAGKARVVSMNTLFSDTATYAYNSLSLMVHQGNPKKVEGLKDLSREDLRISMPNPAWEGIAKQIEKAYIAAGGERLLEAVMKTKVADGSTWLTKIHHRESPLRILNEQSDVAPVWLSEVLYQERMHHPVESIKIPASENIRATYVIAKLKHAIHSRAATDFFNFMQSDEVKRIYRKYGFDTDG